MNSLIEYLKDKDVHLKDKDVQLKELNEKKDVQLKELNEKLQKAVQEKTRFEGESKRRMEDYLQAKQALTVRGAVGMHYLFRIDNVCKI